MSTHVPAQPRSRLLTALIAGAFALFAAAPAAASAAHNRSRGAHRQGHAARRHRHGQHTATHRRIHAGKGHTYAGRLDLFHTDPKNGGADTFTYELQTRRLTPYILHFARNVHPPTPGTRVKLRATRRRNRLYVERVLDVSARGASVTTQAKKLAVILINFQDNKAEPYSPEEVRQTIWTGERSVRDFYTESSFGQLELGSKINPSGDVYGYYTIPYDDSGCPYSTWQEAALSAAHKAGVNLEGYTNIMIVWPEAECGFAGAAYVGGTFSFIDGESLNVGTVAHELGHNFGLQHANALICRNAEGRYVPYEEEGCRFEEYGDPYDVMGRGAGRGFAYEFNDYFKGVLGWWPAGAVQAVTSSGTYLLQPDETDTEGVHLLRVVKNTESNGEPRYYYLEFRAPSRFDDWIERFGEPMWVEQGVTIQLAGEFSNATDVQLLNMNPNVVPPNYSIWPWFAPLTVGESYTDPRSGVSITTDSTTALGALVTVTFPASTKATPPTVSITSPGNGMTASGSVPVSASASDPSGVSSVAFSVDGTPTATVKSEPYSTSWNTTTISNGTHKITATATDRAGESASTSVTVNVSNNSTTGPTGSTGSTTSKTPPTVPSGFAAGALSASQMALSWNPSSDAAGVTGYEIFRNGTLLTTVSTTRYADSGLSAGTGYNYQVRARDTLGNLSALTNPAKVNTPKTSTSGSVAGWVLKKATGLPLNGVKVTASLGGHSWNANTNPAGFYQVQNLAPGTYGVTVVANGYTTQNTTLVVLASLATVEGFAL